MKKSILSLFFAFAFTPAFCQTGPYVSPDEIRRRYIESIGGETAIQNIRDIKVVYQGEVQGVKVTYTESKSQGRIRKEVTVMGNPYQVTVYANGISRNEVQGQRKELSREEIEQLRRDADLQNVLYPDKYGMKRQFLRQDRSDSILYNVLEVTDANGVKTTEFYNNETGDLLRLALTQNSDRGPVSVVVAYSDFRELPGSGGYKIPYSLRQGNAMQELEFQLVDAQVNKGIDPKMFE